MARAPPYLSLSLFLSTNSCDGPRSWFLQPEGTRGHGAGKERGQGSCWRHERIRGWLRARAGDSQGHRAWEKQGWAPSGPRCHPSKPGDRGGSKALVRREDFAFGHRHEVGPDTHPRVSTREQGGTLKREGASGVCVGGSELRVHSGQWMWNLRAHTGDYPGGLVVKTLCFWCRGHRFNPWSGVGAGARRTKIPSAREDGQKKKERERAGVVFERGRWNREDEEPLS